MSSEYKKYVKSFSKGQITVPKEFRKKLGLGDIFWLKLSVLKNAIIAEPVDNNENTMKTDYADKLSGLDGSWFFENDAKKVRIGVNKRMKSNEQ